MSQEETDDPVADSSRNVKVAFAVNGDGSLEHFGHAEEFAVYEFGVNAPVKHELRRASPFCQRADKEVKLVAVTDLLADCQAVICAAIGPCAREELASADIEAFEYDGTVESAIEAIARRPFFIRRVQ